MNPNKPRVHVLLHQGYADWELGYVLPELCGAGCAVVTCALTPGPLRSMGGLQVLPESQLSEVTSSDLLILPGGGFWQALRDETLDAKVRGLHAAGTTVAGICGATGYLARLGLLDHVPHTSNSRSFLTVHAPGYRGHAFYRGAQAVSSPKVITASGLGAIEFTFEIMSHLDIPDSRRWFRAFRHGEHHPDETRTFAILLSKPDGRPTTVAAISAHVAHLQALDADGRLMLAGPFTDHPSGMVVVRAASREEAVALAHADPFVQSGARTVEVREWQLAHRQNDYLLPPVKPPVPA